MGKDALIPIHKTGFNSELEAAKYYASIGYIIYWPMTHQSSVDFIAANGPETIRIQVKSAYWMKRKTGAAYLQATIRKGSSHKDRIYTEDDCDIIAIVHNQEIWIVPVEVVGKETNVILRCFNRKRKSHKGALNLEEYRVK